MAIANTGLTAGQIISPPQPLSPFISFKAAGVTNAIYGFLPILDYLEAAVGGATVDLSVMQANNVILRMDEIEQRENLYQLWRQKFSIWLKIPLGDDTAFSGDGGSKNLRCSF